jgi:surface antigen
MEIRKLFRTSAVCAMMVAALASCQSGGVGQNTAIGAGLGAMVGGLGCAAAGGKAGACIALAGVGALIGGGIGAQIDARDRERRDAALRQARSQSRRVSWRNPQTGNRGTITPLRAVVQNGQNCRVIRENYVKNGEPITAETTDCS